MAEELYLKRNFHYKRKSYKAGTTIELTDKELNDSRIQQFIDKGYLVPAEDVKEDEEETEEEEEESESTKETKIAFLTSIDGIGTVYAEQIKEEFPTLEAIKEAGSRKIADDVPGVGETKAEKILEKVRKVI